MSDTNVDAALDRFLSPPHWRTDRERMRDALRAISVNPDAPAVPLTNETVRRWAESA